MGTKCKRCGKGYGLGEAQCPHCGLSNPHYTPPKAERIDTIIIDRDTAQNAAAGLAQLLDMLAEQGVSHAPVIEETLAVLCMYMEGQE